ncbi:MAG: tetratricopeptide repeat protein [Myxococcaceae bacterium]|nr:tetratricopeptide repeat protein [Myxococcaceae bacterium]
MKFHSRLLSLSAAALLLTSLDAQAQAKKAPAKGAPAKADPKAAEAKKPEVKKPEERKGPARFDAQGQPKAEDIEKEAVADKKRDEQIESAKKIIPKIEDGNPQKADLLFQLGELYWEKSRYLYRREMLKFFDQQKDADEKKNRGEKVSEPKEDHRESELYRSETMRLYETILREYPSYDRKDEVLFNLAYNLYDTGKKDQAVKRYEELLKGYPGSKFVPDTYVQLGNHYFDVANVLEKARSYFEKAFATTNPRIKSYALYKLAWCDFNAGEHEKALKKLQDTVDLAEKGGKEKAFTDLKNEALQDSVRMFVQLNRADDAIAYYKAKAGKKKQTSLIGKLAYGLQEAGHHDNSIKSFRYLLGDNPNSESAPDFQQAIIKSYEGLRQRDNVKAEVKKLAELYRPGSSWWEANKSKKDVLRNGFNVAEEAMRTTVTEYHNEAQKTKSVATYRLARDIYKQYIDAFATSEDEQFVSDHAFNLKFYYAEILWALEEWEPAAGQYDSVTAFKIPGRSEAKEISQEKYRQTAAYNAILSYDKLVKIERGLLQKSDLKEGQVVEETKKKDKVEKSKKVQKRTIKELEEKPITKFEQALIAACDKYNQLYPKTQEEVDIAYQAAVIYYDKNHFVEAARRFGDIINRYPEEGRSADAADLSMGVLEEKEEWLELNKLARLFKANEKLMKKAKPDFVSRVGNVVEGSQYKYVDEVVYKKDKDVKKARDLFLDFQKEFPKSKNAARAMVYAMEISREANEQDKSIEIGERILKEYPNSMFDLRVKNGLAFFYEKLASFEKSAAMYENFIATYDLAAGDKAIGYENIKQLLKDERDAREKAEKAAKAAKKELPKTEVVTTFQVPKNPAKWADNTPITSEELKALTDEREAQKKAAADWVADAQYNAGFWYEGVGKFDKAIAAYKRYVARFKDKKDAPEIAFNIGLVLEKTNQLAEATKHYDAFLTTYAKDPRVNDTRKLDLKYRQFLIAQKLKDNTSVDRLAKDIAAAFPKLKEDEKKQDRAMLAAAHTKFYLLEPQFNAYTATKFKQIATFKKDLPAKQKSLTELEKAYTEVLTVGNPDYGIAALTRIGLLYSDLAQNLVDLPDPKGFDEDQLAIFRGEIENRYVFPLEEKAVEALEKALAKSSELTLYTEWTITAQDKLNKYKPGTYGKTRDVQYRGSEFFVTSGFEKQPPANDAPLPTEAETPKVAPAPTPTPAPGPSASATGAGAGSR